MYFVYILTMDNDEVIQRYGAAVVGDSSERAGVVAVVAAAAVGGSFALACLCRSAF